jgi:hypothetical protein
MCQGRREAAINHRRNVVLAKGFPCKGDRLVEAPKVNEGNPHSREHQENPGVDWAQADGALKTPESFLRLPNMPISQASSVPCIG